MKCKLYILLLLIFTLSLFASTRSEKAEALIMPVVRLRTSSSVASAVLIYANDTGAFLLTARHAVILNDHPKKNIRVEVFDPTGQVQALPQKIYKAEVYAWSEFEDIAILTIEKPEGDLFLAKLPTKEDFAGVGLFDGVYAVGATVQLPPMHTRGEITLVSSVLYGMSAPVCLGNSGGGVFLAEDYSLIGIIVGIENDGPNCLYWHKAAFVPMNIIYDFLFEESLEFIIPE